MKKTTCEAMGGCCAAEITGETAEELMENGKKHVHDSEDEGHKAIIEKMEKLTEEEHKKWAEDFKHNFDSLENA